jgi:acetyl-CoA acetyltransferase family protein
MSAINHARRAIAVGDGDVFIAGGVEHMTRGPWVLSKTEKPFGRNMELFDSSFGWRFINPKMEKLYGTEGMGNTAENLAEKYNIPREAQDQFAYNSQRKASIARESGRLAEEIVPVPIPRRKQEPLVFDQDEFIKPATTVEVLSTLRTAFKTAEDGGTVTAGNASGLNDGAAATIIASEDAVEKYGLKPMARILAAGISGVEPQIMGIGPVYASAIALKRAGLKLDQIDVIEINEAFAAQCLACFEEMGLDPQDPRVNPNGGAIAIGHPLGMSGTRIAYSAALELHKTDGRYALATMCVGVGQGYAMILERV